MITNNENGRPNENSGHRRDGKSFERGDRKPFSKGTRGDARSFNNPRSDRPRSSSNFRDKDENRPHFGEKRNYDRKPFSNDDRNNRPFGNRNRFNNDDRNSGGLSFKKKTHNSDETRDGKLSFRKASEVRESKYTETRFQNDDRKVSFRPRKNSENYDPNAKYSRKKQFEYQKSNVDPTKPVRLNKFLANAGICSRREADEYIQAGVITVNGEVISELGAKILPTDKVMFHDQPVRSERKIYLLLNKPKDCVTTSEDTHARLTVLDLVKNACSERIYPVGRLDRNTTGVLLLTNDGDLASRLTHPKYEKKKIYHVVLDRDLEREDFDKILSGVELEDFNIAADALDFVKEDSMKEVGIEIHSGQNRVVRRIFEKLGYKIMRLDRVYFAGLTKKNLPRGKFRFLNEREVNMLKMGAYE